MQEKRRGAIHYLFECIYGNPPENRWKDEAVVNGYYGSIGYCLAAQGNHCWSTGAHCTTDCEDAQKLLLSKRQLHVVKLLQESFIFITRGGTSLNCYVSIMNCWIIWFNR